MQSLFSRFTTLVFLAVLGGAVALVGCDSAGFEEDSSEQDQAQVNVQITSGSATSGSATSGSTTNGASASGTQAAPPTGADIESAVVTIASIELVGEDTSHLLSDQEQEIDLLELQGAVENLALGEVPAGEYDRLLLKVTETQLALADGTTPNLKVPSGKIRILLPDLEIEEGGDEAEITVEFDVEQSFVKAGKSGKYIFKPVVRTESVALNGEDLDDEVEIAGQITGYAEDQSVEIEGFTFAITSETEIDEELTLSEGESVELEGGLDESGTYVAQEIEAREDEEEDEGAVLEAPLGDVLPDQKVIELLGKRLDVTADTEFDGFLKLADLSSSSRVEVVFDYDASTASYRLLKIESESSDEGNDEDEGEEGEDEDHETAAEVTGQITATVQDGSLAVGGLEFGVTAGTEVEGVADLASLQTGQHVQLEATYMQDGALVATEIEVEEDVEDEPSTLEAAVESISDETLTLLGTSFRVDDTTELEGFSSLGDLEQGDEVKVAFAYDEPAGTHRALKIETEADDD